MSENRYSNKVKKEKYFSRDLLFSQWHRKCLYHWTYACDVDFIEYRYINNKIEIVGIIETKKYYRGYKKNFKVDFNIKALFTLSKRINVPFFIILYHLPENIIKTENCICENRQNNCFFYIALVNDDFIQKYSNNLFTQYFKKVDNKTLQEIFKELPNLKIF